MMEGLMQRTEPIRSRAILDSARGQECTFHFPGVCNHDRETTVSAHITDDAFGMSQKANDFATVHACSACHMYYDQRLWIGTLSLQELYWYVIRALFRTLRNRLERGVYQVKLDAPKPFHARPVKSRKPKAERAKVGPSRPLQSRPMRRANER